MKVVALLILLVLVLGACSTKTDSGSGSGGGDTNAGPPKPGGTLNVGISAETDGFNPTNSQWAAQGYWVASSIMEPLTTWGTDNKVHPYLAESVTPNADFTQWTIKLRKGINFQDGTPFNADAVVLQLTKDKASLIVGQAMTAVSTINKVDEYTVQVGMSRPWAQFPVLLATQAGYMASPKQLNSTGKDLTDHPIGTGPYTFKEWVRSDHLTVTKNPNWWRKGQGLANPDQITYKVISDPQAMLNSLQAGQVDLEFDGTVSNIVQAEGNSGLKTVEKNLDAPVMIMLNMAVEPTSDLRVRQALAYATDAQQILDRVDQGRGKTADGPYLPDSPWYAPSGYPVKPDEQKAKELLDEYKKDKGITGNVKIQLGCTPTTTNDQAMQLIQQQWEKVGFDVSRKSLEQATYINDALLGNYEANCWTYLGSQDPDIDAIWMLSRNANPPGQLALNFPRLKDPKVDDAYLAAQKTDDQKARLEQYAIVWKQLAQDVPYVWLTHTYGAFIYRSNVHWVANPKLPDGSAAPTLQNSDSAVASVAQAWIG
jgi:peptide/nickel transport system substrate-binding protein